MDYLLGCIGGVLCALCGFWAARGIPRPRRRPPSPDTPQEASADDLTRDIAALLAYQLPGKEELDAQANDADG